MRHIPRVGMSLALVLVVGCGIVEPESVETRRTGQPADAEPESDDAIRAAVSARTGGRAPQIRAATRTSYYRATIEKDARGRTVYNCNPGWNLADPWERANGFQLELVRPTPRGMPGRLRAVATASFAIPDDAFDLQGHVFAYQYDDENPEIFFYSPANFHARQVVVPWAAQLKGPGRNNVSVNIDHQLRHWHSVENGQRVYRVVGGVDDLGGGGGNYLHLFAHLRFHYKSYKGCYVRQWTDYWNPF